MIRRNNVVAILVSLFFVIGVFVSLRIRVDKDALLTYLQEAAQEYTHPIVWIILIGLIAAEIVWGVIMMYQDGRRKPTAGPK